jgi:hypothetical protein
MENLDKKDYLIQALIHQRDEALNALAQSHANFEVLTAEANRLGKNVIALTNELDGLRGFPAEQENEIN